MAAIKKLYGDLKLKEMFEAYEEQSFQELKAKIANVKVCMLRERAKERTGEKEKGRGCRETASTPTLLACSAILMIPNCWLLQGLPQNVFEGLLAKIYKRSK